MGGAAAVAQVDTLTPANVETTDAFTATLTAEDGSTTESVTFAATSNTVANVTAGLVAAINALVVNPLSLFSAVSATDNGTNLTVTARVAGVPFFLTTSTVDHGGSNTQTLGDSHTTANAGPKYFATAANWSANAVPANGDDVLFSGRAQNELIYGLYQTGIALNSIIPDMAMQYDIGTTKFALQIGATLVDLGAAPTDGSSAAGCNVNLNTGSGQTTFIVRNSRTAGKYGRAPYQLVGTHASNRLSITGGTAGFGTAIYGQSGTLFGVTASGGNLSIGAGASLTATNTEIDVLGGQVTINSAVQKIKTASGICTVNGTGLVSTLDMRGGKTYLNNRPSNSIAIALLLMNDRSAVLDVRGDPRPLTITATTRNVTAQILATSATQVTHTDGNVVYSETASGASSSMAAD